MAKRAAKTSGNKTSKKLKLSPPGSLDHMILPPELEGQLDFKPTSTTQDNRPWNLKIISWNVNGIRAVVKSGKLAYLKFEDPDVICLQETKCSDADIPEEAKFHGYHRYYNAAVKKGYSSTALYSKVKPINVAYGIDKPEHDSEGRVITAEYSGFYVVNVYVPNSGQKTARLPYRRTWNTDFLEYCKHLDSLKPVIVAGDMNVAHTAIDLANPKSNVKSSGFTVEEREDLGTWLSSGFVDSFRHFSPDVKGAYTFWTYMGGARARNVGWRIDYFVVSARFMENVAANVIRGVVKGSDHCPIMLLVAEGSKAPADKDTQDGKVDNSSEVGDKDNKENGDETNNKENGDETNNNENNDDIEEENVNKDGKVNNDVDKVFET